MMRAAPPSSKIGANDALRADQVFRDERRGVSLVESADYEAAMARTLGRARWNNSWMRMRSGLLMRQFRDAEAI